MPKNKTGIINFFNSLVMSFKTDDLLSNTLERFDELNTNVRHMYGCELKLSFSSELHGKVEKSLQRHLKTNASNAYVTIAKLAEKISKDQDFIESLIEDNFADNMVRERLDYRKLNILKYIESISYFNDFAKKFANSLVMAEFDSETVSNILTVVDRNQLAFVDNEANIFNFAKVCKNLELPVKDVISQFDKLEGIVFDEDQYDSTRAVSGSKIDPLAQGFLPVAIDPFYHVGLIWNDFRNFMRKRNKEELNNFKSKILLLEEKKDGADAKEIKNIEKQIKYYADRVNKLNAKLEDIAEGD